jgi:hypothetical protein
VTTSISTVEFITVDRQNYSFLSSNQFFVPISGLYQINILVEFDNADRSRLGFAINGAAIIAPYFVTTNVGSGSFVNTSFTYSVTAGQAITGIFETLGASSITSDQHFISITRIGAS